MDHTSHRQLLKHQHQQLSSLSLLTARAKHTPRLTEQYDQQSGAMGTDSSPGQDDSQIANSETSTSTDAPGEGPTEQTSISAQSSLAMGGAAAEQAAVAPPPVFLDRTYSMVDTGPDDVVSWSENGDSFIIKKVDAFEAMLPAFFNHRNFLSFVRQLNLYGESNLFLWGVAVCCGTESGEVGVGRVLLHTACTTMSTSMSMCVCVLQLSVVLYYTTTYFAVVFGCAAFLYACWSYAARRQKKWSIADS